MKRILLGRFWLPPLFHAQSLSERILNAVMPPVAWGILCGLLSGVDSLAYAIGLALSLIGAFGAGRQHLGARAGALRGLAVGATFGASVLAGNALGGGAAEMLPDPRFLQVAFAATIASGIAAIGGLTRRRGEAGNRLDPTMRRPARVAAQLPPVD